MTDKVQKIRNEVEKLKAQLIRGACSSQIAMETRCKEEAYNEVLAIFDTLQEEPVSEDFEEALAKEWQGYVDRGAATVDALEDNTQELAFAKGFYLGAKWGKNQEKVEIQVQSMALAHGCPKESITEELENAAIQYGTDEFPSLCNGCKHIPTDAFKAGAEWEENQMKVVYVITRCEEHSDYVEEVFLDEPKAKEYCKQFEGNEDAYARHITKIQVSQAED